MKIPSITAVRKVLHAAVFNPRKDQELRIIAELDNEHYFKCRVIELLQIDEKAIMTPDQRKATLISAIRLLVLLYLKRHGF